MYELMAILPTKAIATDLMGTQLPGNQRAAPTPRCRASNRHQNSSGTFFEITTELFSARSET